MFKKMISALCGCAFVLIMVGCNMGASTEELARDVQSTLRKEVIPPWIYDYDEPLILVNKEGHTYVGVYTLTTKYRNTLRYDVEVTYDGNKEGKYIVQWRRM